MIIRVTLNRRTLLIVLTTFALLLAGGIAFAKYKQGHTEAKYYGKQLEQLKEDAAAIDFLNKGGDESKASLKDQLDQYQGSLKSIVSTCQKTKEHTEKSKDSTKLKNLREPVDKVTSLCNDLNTVTEYARKQADVAQGLVLFPADSLAKPESLPAFQEVLTTTKPRLEALRQDPINDPAVPELIALIEELQKLKDEAASGDQARLDALAKRAKIHQNNFLTARAYYWTNTIGMEDLRNSIEKQKANFGQ